MSDRLNALRATAVARLLVLAALLCTGRASAQAWTSDAIPGNRERTYTTFTANGNMTYHNTHHLRPFPTFIFKDVREMQVGLEVVGAGGGTPEITSIHMTLRNKNTDSIGYWPSVDPADVDLMIAGREAFLTLDPSRLVADVWEYVEYGMTKVRLVVEYDIPPFAEGDSVEVAFVMVPTYQASVSSVGGTLSVRLYEVMDLQESANTIYGVNPLETPATGLRLNPVSSDLYFDPPEVTIDTGHSGFRYFAPVGSFDAESPHVVGGVEFDIPGANRAIANTRLLTVYARVNSVSGDVKISRPLSPDYVALQADAVVQPFDSVKMRVRVLQGGGLEKPYLNMSFYDGTKADIEIFNTADLAEKDVVITFDKLGNISRRHVDFVTDLTDFGYTVAHNPRAYMRIGISKTFGFLAGQLTGGFGWLASQASEEIVEYGMNKLGEYNRPSPRRNRDIGPTDPGTLSSSVPGHIDPSGAERVMNVEWLLMSDGKVHIENNGGAIEVVAESEGLPTTRLGAFSRAMVDTQRECISQAAALPPHEEYPDLVLEFTPASGSVVTTAMPRLEVAIPFPGEAYAYPRSLECRLNGRLISPYMVHTYQFAEYKSVASYQTPWDALLPEGENELEAALLRHDGRRYEARAVFTVASIPRTPGGLRALNGRGLIALRWNPSPETDIVGYRVFRSALSSDLGAAIGECSQPVFVDSGAEAATPYWYRVQALGGAGRISGASVPVHGQRNPLASMAAPDAPGALTTAPIHGGIRIGFDDTAWNAVGWRLERGASSAGPFQPLLGGELLAWSEHVDRTVTSGSTYYYRLIPQGMDGQLGTAVVSAGVTAAPQSATAPAGLTAHRTGDNAVFLRWDPPPEGETVLEHRVYMAREGAAWINATSVPAPSVSCALPVTEPGVYAFQVSAVGGNSVESSPGGIALVSFLLESPIVHVNRTSASPMAPYASWATASSDIQSAIDASAEGYTVLVNDGVYNTGGRAVYGDMLNRVVVDRALTVRSVNGPEQTIIEGQRDPGTGGVGAQAIRAVHLAQGATLDGFTVRHGATRGWGPEYSPVEEQSGGGVWSGGGARVQNCVVVSNIAWNGGGLYNVQSYAGFGGAYNSWIADNRALDDGGGLCNSTAYNCLITGNRGSVGGGGFSVQFYNCTVVSNRAVSGGGFAGGTVVNSIVYGNTASSDANWGYGDMSPNLSFTCTTPLPGGSNPGNIANDPLFVNAATGNYRPTAASPCTDAGTYKAWMETATDLDGNPRILFGNVDMGCYESAAMADTDADGIPDWWERFYFGGPTSAVATSLAANGRHTLKESFIAGMDPHDADACFGVAAPQRTGNATVVRWPSAAGRRYALDRSIDLTAPDAGFEPWRTRIAATPPENTETVPASTNEDNCFYRVRVSAE